MLKFCTLTGVDQNTNLQETSNLSLKYPVVEWGFLYSPKHREAGRYPGKDFILEAFQQLPPHVNVALHVCGEGVSQLLTAESTMLEFLRVLEHRQGSRRIQLNFNHKQKPVNISAIRALCDRFKSISIITQHNANNEQIWKFLYGTPNYSVLFDSSGGLGIETAQLEKPFGNMFCGYAGGFGPDNIDYKLIRISELLKKDHPYWIDMETNLRTITATDDFFDLAKCAVVLTESAKFV